MIGRDSHDDINGYGIWPWILGVALAAVIIIVMFTFAQPIS
ncbi:dihydroxy-acid dehydratase [Primorskyibacter aestuariivivens]|nr:dihydroxy-acid dehydratase [Primorskyibacter aestuariivivens]MDA7430976.1 dihydroxy-acid dehydratase [Primorskyibacter aestuariivivens]